VTDTLSVAAVRALETADPAAKTGAVLEFATAWREGAITQIGAGKPPDRPARPARPELRLPRDMPRRRRAHSETGRIALLHALAHIELNAVDLACDIIARFTADDPPREFYDDWVSVAADEARHFSLLAARLDDFGAAYGDLPAHDGLWEAATETAHDLLARLAIVPLVLEARGLDVTPPMIKNLHAAGDPDSAEILETSYKDEITHVAAGTRWFEHVCRARGHEPVSTYQDLVRRHFRSALKPPFNEDARDQAGLTPEYYGPLAAR
jgi:uncharacterized ferritin-like protein (DUF455 family)